MFPTGKTMVECLRVAVSVCAHLSSSAEAKFSKVFSHMAQVVLAQR